MLSSFRSREGSPFSDSDNENNKEEPPSKRSRPKLLDSKKVKEKSTEKEGNLSSSRF